VYRIVSDILHHLDILFTALRLSILVARFANTMMQQYNMGMRWEATNWNGACDELIRIA